MSNKQILLVVIGLVFLCVLSILLFTLPRLWGHFDLSTNSTSNIGSTIGGITAPLIGIASSILLYSTLIKQIEANREQRAKNELDVVFGLLNKLEKDIAAFSTEDWEGISPDRKKITLYGAHGLDHFVSNKLWYLQESDECSFSHIFEGPRISLIANLINLVEKRIHSIITEDNTIYKELIFERVNTIYEYQLKVPFENIIKIIESKPALGDSLTENIKSYVQQRF